ncbi:tropomyosin like-domain-containing protein [Aspergillus cavernicola]|uniref:Tropomyosin like-domain-containing protein n=1 Tax=Aspergillus cavernicola TaxID=176166 RepID=A0ABR4HNE1_9EURO
MDRIKENEALQRRLELLEEQVDEADINLRKTQQQLDQADSKADQYERKVQLLEEEAEVVYRNLCETRDKLHQADIKADQYKYKVQRLELECEQWQRKYNELEKNYKASKEEFFGETERRFMGL